MDELLGVFGLNRAFLQQLSAERTEDARALLAAHRWSGAYYLVGYALECALKSCVVAYVERNIEVIFGSKGFQNKCWTHELESLLDLADLRSELEKVKTSNPKIAQNWLDVKDWSELSRYQMKTQSDAEKLFEAVTNNSDGVLPWVKTYW